MEILTANEPASKWEPSLLSRDRGDLLPTDSQCLFSTCTGETHKTSTCAMARLASFIKLTVQNHINKNRSPSREKTSLVKTLKARARGGKNGGTLPKPCQDDTIKDCFLLKQSMFARFVKTPLWKWIGLVHASKILHFCLQWRVSVQLQQWSKSTRDKARSKAHYKKSFYNWKFNKSVWKPEISQIQWKPKIYIFSLYTNLPSALKMIQKLMISFVHKELLHCFIWKISQFPQRIKYII